MCHDLTGNVLPERSVTEGSILNPLLYIIHKNDNSSVLLDTKFHSYADDLQIYAHYDVSKLNEAVTLINGDIDKNV